MIKTRPRCPCCGSRLNENAIHREIDFDDGSDILIQDIGGRGNVSNLGKSTFDENLDVAQYFLDNVNLAKKYLEQVLGIEQQDDSSDAAEDDSSDAAEDDSSDAAEDDSSDGTFDTVSFAATNDTARNNT